MTPAQVLAALCALRPGLPEGAAVTVPIAWLSEALDGSGDTGAPSAGPVPRADWTVRELADRFGRRPGTVRAWVEAGRFPGAYRMHGSKEWRIPASALAAFEEAQRQGGRQAGARFRTKPKAVDLGAWRRATG
jgi:excisionase family DNA binding protein